MIACLRSSRFSLPDGSAPVFLDLRRVHNIQRASVSGDNKHFVVSKRISKFAAGSDAIINKGFEHLNEARTYWCAEAIRLEDEGRVRMDFHISGFHDED